MKFTWAFRDWYKPDGGGKSLTEWCEYLEDEGWEIFSVRKIGERNAIIVVRKPR